MHRGYVKLWRKGVENALFKRPLVWHFWCYCLMRANYKDCEIEFKGKPLFLKRGSFLMSYRSASDKTGLTTRNIRTAVTVLVNFGMVEKSTQQTTQQATVLTVCNYDLYQSENLDNDTASDTAATQQRHSSDTAATLDKKDKELIKKVKKKKDSAASYSEPFERWWKTYPLRNGRKVGKKAAARVFSEIKKADWSDLKSATENYSRECNGKPKDAERFLRNEFWREYLGKPQACSKTEHTEKRMTQEELDAFLREGLAATNNQEEFEAWLKPRCIRCWRIAYEHQQLFYEKQEPSNFRLFWFRYKEEDE